MIGRMISERYELKQLLGGGGMSNVYMAWDIILNRKVALKMIHIPPNEKHETIKRFEREVQSTTLLTHENIVNVLDVGEEEDCFFLVMEYIEGPTLSDYIKTHGPLPPQKAVQFFEQILKGIQHVHEKGIVHRDIKPQNMIINRDQVIKIVDFGIAKALSETAMTQTNHVVGTVQYLSPEQAKGEKTGERSDIYSLGIVLYEMLIGSPPFTGETPVSIAIKQIQETVPNVTEKRKDVPQSLSNVILKATEKDQSHRYRSVSEMAHDTSTALNQNRANETRYYTDENATKTLAIDKQSIANAKAQHKKNTNKTAQIPIIPTKERQNKDMHYQSTPTKPKRSLRKKIWFSIIFLLLFIGLFVFMLAAMTGNKYSQVPNVIGQNEEDAKSQIEKQHLKVGQVTSSYSDDYDKGRVIKSSPTSESKVRQNSSVDLVVSKGPHIEKMPNVIGLPKLEAEAKLKALGIEKINYNTAYTESNIAKGNIEAQSVNPNENVHVTKDEVTLTESLGKQQVYIGDYTNQSFESVKNELENEGMSVVVEKMRSDNDIPKDYIINHTPKNKEVDKGEEVRFIVSTGSDKEDQKDKETQDKANDNESDDASEAPDKQYQHTISIPYSGKDEKPQKVEIFIKDKDNNYSSPSETFSITKNTQHAVNLVVEDGEEASYTVKVDGKTVADNTIQYDDF